MEGLLLLQEQVGRERRPLSWVMGDRQVSRPLMPSQRDHKRAERGQATDLLTIDRLPVTELKQEKWK
jgi:NADH-quinone oxidoreductase subunit B